MVITDFFKFMANGFAVWRDAIHGEYDGANDEIRQIREDFLNKNFSKADDARNIRQDWRMVGRDCRVAFNKTCQSIKQI